MCFQFFWPDTTYWALGSALQKVLMVRTTKWKAVQWRVRWLSIWVSVLILLISKMSAATKQVFSVCAFVCFLNWTFHLWRAQYQQDYLHRMQICLASSRKQSKWAIKHIAWWLKHDAGSEHNSTPKKGRIHTYIRWHKYSLINVLMRQS